MPETSHYQKKVEEVSVTSHFHQTFGACGRRSCHCVCMCIQQLIAEYCTRLRKKKDIE